jgi:hypothetical protein
MMSKGASSMSDNEAEMPMDLAGSMDVPGMNDHAEMPMEVSGKKGGGRPIATGPAKMPAKMPGQVGSKQNAPLVSNDDAPPLAMNPNAPSGGPKGAQKPSLDDD